MVEASQSVMDLLTYIEEAEKLRTKPSFSIPTEFFAAYQQDLQGLPELQLNVPQEGDDIWLKVPRLQEIAAPDIGDALRPWVTLSKSVDKPPELKPESERVPLNSPRELAPNPHITYPEIKAYFDWYVENQWQPWSGTERLRRKTMALYNKLFALQQTISSGGSETPIELVWGMGYSTWKRPGQGSTVKRPLLVQGCEITLNSRTFDLEIRARDVDTRLELDCYAEMDVPGIWPLEAFWKSAQASTENRVDPFDSSTFQSVLKAAVGYLDPTGSYDERTESAELALAGDKLLITNTWVVYARKRNSDIFLEDIRRLKKTVETAAELPAVIRSFVEEGDDAVRVRAEVPFRGLSSSDGSAAAKELYFPLPYNDEQISIIQKLEANDGVVVQGPPGTGKTHTIANVICHYLAMGKRVLVTSKGETALAVLQEKLPERIRPLSVALLSEDREGLRQFEHSIQSIATGVEGIQPQRVEKTIERLESELTQLHAKISHVDQTISAQAAGHMRNYVFQGQELSPEDLAKWVMEQATEHDWFDDTIAGAESHSDSHSDIVDADGTDGMQSTARTVEPISAESSGLQDSDLNALRVARANVGTDLADYLHAALPGNQVLPDWGQLVSLRQDLLKSRQIEAAVQSGAVLPLRDARPETLESAKSLRTFLDQYVDLQARLQRHASAAELLRRLADTPRQDPLLAGLMQACETFKALEDERKQFITKAIGLPRLAENHADFVAALERLTEGKSAFVLPFGKSEARQLVSAVTLLGAAPSGQDDWRWVQKLVRWRHSAQREAVRWSAISAEFGLTAPVADMEAAVSQIAQQQAWVLDAWTLVFDFQHSLPAKIEQVFGQAGLGKGGQKSPSWLGEMGRSLEAHLDQERLGYAARQIDVTLSQLRDKSGPLVEKLRKFLQQDLLIPALTDAELQARWLALQAELARLNGLALSLAEIRRVTRLVEQAGAPRWAQRLITLAPQGEPDAVLPLHWREAWQWRLAFQFLEAMDVHKKFRTLFEERRVLTASLSRTYQELVAEKTWLGVYNNSPQSTRQALQAYLNSVQAMGAGTGIRAVRHRRHARDAMQKAYMAVPCWVLPQWRVSESIPAEMGLFDLVIIDEASQSDIWALPVLLRGKKLLIVGDHKQVSPVVFIKESKIDEMEKRFLNQQVYGAQMTPDKSIYDLARVVFAGNSVMLKEHFRCVPAIIEFSNREFYNGDIKPLRVPKANERLDPPLIDVFVKGGFRKGDTNPPEAQAIVDEVEAILQNPQLQGRSIGIVTLLGNEQAKYIHDLIHKRISPADIVAHQIAVGPPPVFQGRERDIMMVSMVLAAGDRSAANIAAQQQRFNVAFSRARDRLYLFRSVAHNQFAEDSLNGKVLQHFRQPFKQDVKKVELLRDLCESGFERDMFDELTQRGYRVQPQVRCGAYRIDFVVEGSEGRRLALECDGDRFHGPGQWADDMARQRVLERAGWTFWRCFASSFARRRAEVMADLVATLTSLHIEPLGAQAVDNTVWVELREVDPLAVENLPLATSPQQRSAPEVTANEPILILPLDQEALT